MNLLALDSNRTRPLQISLLILISNGFLWFLQRIRSLQTPLFFSGVREEFSSHLVVKEDEIKEKNRRIEYAEQCLTTLNLELKAGESKMQSYGTEISSLKLEIKVLVEKLETANAKAQSYDKEARILEQEKIHLEQSSTPVKMRSLEDVYARCHMSIVESENYKEADGDIAWEEAINAELEMIEKNNTWELVNRPADKPVK